MTSILLSLVLSQPAFANSTGITGYSTSGCTGCHGAAASGTTGLTFGGSTTAEVGETLSLTLKVSHSTQKAAGLNISASGGTLAAGSNTRLASSQITHSSPQTMSGGAVTFNYSWTAPSTPGTYTIYAAGNAVNSNGASSGDFWNKATTTITVTEACDDDDADGWTTCDGDCDDTDADLNLDDTDLDGYSTCDDDCDDNHPDISPGDSEICDDEDNDCNGTIDDFALDADTWYLDSDSDGYGDTSVEACEDPGASYIATGGDCDDTDADFHPGAAESCDDPNDYNCDGTVTYADVDSDGWAACDECDDTDSSVFPTASEYCDDVDNDCDGEIDEDTAVDASTWYLDFDGDGYGDPGVTAEGCDAPTGYVANSDDCNDKSSLYYPGATEVCGDPNDYNCDGALSTDDSDGDGYASCEDCDDSDASVYPGALEACDGVITDCDLSAVPADETDDDGDRRVECAFVAASWDGPSNIIGGDDCDDDDATVYPAAPQLCDGQQNDCSIDATVSDEIDDDGDGYVECELDEEVEWQGGTEPVGGGDCDDADAAFNPGADESCSEDVDYNCDGSTLYADEDSDGWAACDDCNDDAADVNPDAEEHCNKVDDDCDKSVDESPVDAASWFMDADGDGYGLTSDAIESCDEPDGYAAVDGDCDDADAGAFPGATEVAGDGVDQDCDGEDPAGDSGDTNEPGDDTDEPDGGGDTGEDDKGGCAGCSSPASAPSTGAIAWVVGLLGAALLRRRRSA